MSSHKYEDEKWKNDKLKSGIHKNRRNDDKR